MVGSGLDGLPDWEEQGYKVTRLDIEPRVNPDICAPMTAMGEIGSFDVVYCCHALEHLYPHEVYLALKEFARVLTPGGVAVIVVPDLEDVKPTEERIGMPGANLCGLHLFYGDASQIAEFPHMAHHCGFVAVTLKSALDAVGFAGAKAMRMGNFNLMGLGVRAA